MKRYLAPIVALVAFAFLGGCVPQIKAGYGLVRPLVKPLVVDLVAKNIVKADEELGEEEKEAP